MAEFKRKKLLTRPVLKLAEGATVYVLIERAMYIGKDMKQKDGDKKKEPATILDCVNLETGEQCQVLASAVIKSVLTEEYPNDGYVNKGFAFTKQARQPGKQYNPVHIEEVELPEQFVQKSAPAAPAEQPAARAAGARK